MKNRKTDVSNVLKPYTTKSFVHKSDKSVYTRTYQQQIICMRTEHSREVIQQLVESAEKVILEISKLSNTDLYRFHAKDVETISNLREVLDDVAVRFKQPLAHYSTN